MQAHFKALVPDHLCCLHDGERQEDHRVYANLVERYNGEDYSVHEGSHEFHLQEWHRTLCLTGHWNVSTKVNAL